MDLARSNALLARENTKLRKQLKEMEQIHSDQISSFQDLGSITSEIGRSYGRPKPICIAKSKHRRQNLESQPACHTHGT